MGAGTSSALINNTKMGITEIFLIGVGLSMDAFAVSICKGLSCQKLKVRHYLCVGLWFGGFQALMPTLGYLLGSTFAEYISSIDHWIAFGLLVIIGANMIREALKKGEEEVNSSFGVKTMLLLAIATSIDALAVGVTFALTGVSIVLSASIIGCTTFVLSAVGLWVGHVFGAKYKTKAQITGGVVLILIGIKILLEHLEIINF